MADVVKTPISYRISEFVVPTIIAFAIISSFIIVYYALTNNDSQNITTNSEVNTDSFAVQVISEGTGKAAEAGDKVEVYYSGSLKNGTVFDASKLHENDGKIPTLPFTIGASEVIPGMEQGVLGMKVGEKRIITIPPSLGYGSQDLGAIPANSTLIFEVEMVKIGE